MHDLDPDDPRPPYQQVANALRAAILTRTFQPGEKLPSGPELSKRYGVARMTVQQAVRLLRDEGLVVSRQGSGVFVRERTERPVGLRPHMDRAFEAPQVTVDFAGFSGETLHGAIAEPLDKVRAGRLRPESITVRILVPNPAVPWTLPARVEDLGDSPAFRERATQIMQRHTQAIVDAVTELRELGLVDHTRAEVRVAPAVPMFKLYLLNDTEAFFGYYPVQEHAVQLDGESVTMWDLMGKDATLFHHSADVDPDSMASQFVAQSKMWFDSMWSTVARPVRQ
ncbi:winged helix-turn-helix domain-containing protein [Pseudonocardia bannensis]|uniref:Winged helix-turn-helix transcriptional regulator n=1 Tax=Pseudonocardia bannensis TaxID=630973 RepID=A0A848DF61_9PSEU|nr:winged helix-turn-helix domain-containing protein [Pseudonocardia bannensis]NMH91278.1 winged helix-turn-helix transcriptional regulator [Pseudonocardia bannensis]